MVSLERLKTNLSRIENEKHKNEHSNSRLDE